MRKKLSILLAGALVASAFSALPAQAAPDVPSDDDANIVDAAGDANYVSPQGGPGGGVNRGAADILKVWFTDTPDTISAHIQTTLPGPSSVGVLYTVRVDPGVGRNCLLFRGFGRGPGNADLEGPGQLRQSCQGATSADVEFVQEEGPDGTGIHTITAPRSAYPAFTDGTTLATPKADTAHIMVAAYAPTLDNTAIGKDYVVGSGGAPSKPEEPKAEPPGKNDPPGQGNQDCSKIKNKKKKKACKKNSGKGNPPAAKGCEDFKPGERGAEVEDPTVKLTDEHTEEAPLEYEVELGQSLADVNPGPLPAPFAVTADAFNVQVDTKGDDVGVWALFQFPTHRDYDLDMFHADGSYAARSRGFNPAAGTPLSATGHGGEHGFNYEKLLGIRTQKCGGWTLEASNHLGEGGKFKVKLWLGEAVTDPLEPGKATP